ncbi:hypothetical protein ACP70R_004690 [Stipagrostis hirtigluma subsp. patula]
MAARAAKLTAEAKMGLSRRFLNLIVDIGIPGAKSLRCIDLTRQKLFDTTSSPKPPSRKGSESEEGTRGRNRKNKRPAPLTIEAIRFPRKGFYLRAASMSDGWSLDCFPLADRKVLCADQSGRTVLFDAETLDISTVPALRNTIWSPVSLFVPGADADEHDYGGSLFVMESRPDPEPKGNGHSSHQFEALVYGKPTSTSIAKSWHSKLLPPPPFIRDLRHWENGRPRISSYGVVGGGSQVFVSVEGVGTFCLDTVEHTWSEIGEWTLPFSGKVEYVPDLKLWIGLSAEDQCLAAADLSTMDTKPQLIGTWKELDPPKEWWITKDSQLVNIGSGKFCIARFFHTNTPVLTQFGKEIFEQHFVILTGVEVVPRVGKSSGNANGCKGKVGLHMIRHKSKYHMAKDRATIKSVF